MIPASSSAGGRIVGQARHVPAIQSETRASTMDPQPPAITTDEIVETGKSPWVLAAVFIVVEIVLMAETISVILLGGSEQLHRGVTPIAILLSTALLANLGLVCSFIAASAASAVRRSRRAGAIPIPSFTAISCGAEGVESMAGDLAAVDVVTSANGPDTAASAGIPTSR
jgi:hypothetical protein